MAFVVKRLEDLIRHFGYPCTSIAITRPRVDDSHNISFILKILDQDLHSREATVRSVAHIEVNWKKKMNRDLKQGQAGFEIKPLCWLD